MTGARVLIKREGVEIYVSGVWSSEQRVPGVCPTAGKREPAGTPVKEAVLRPVLRTVGGKAIPQCPPRGPAHQIHALSENENVYFFLSAP